MNGSNDIWKWLAAFLAGAMLAGAPSYALLLTKPTQDDFQKLQVGLTALQIQQAQTAEQITGLQQQINRLILEQQGRPVP